MSRTLREFQKQIISKSDKKLSIDDIYWKLWMIDDSLTHRLDSYVLRHVENEYLSFDYVSDVCYEDSILDEFKDYLMMYGEVTIDESGNLIVVLPLIMIHNCNFEHSKRSFIEHLRRNGNPRMVLKDCDELRDVISKAISTILSERPMLGLIPVDTSVSCAIV